MGVYRRLYSCVLLLMAGFSAPCQPLTDAAPLVDLFLPVAVPFQRERVLLRGQAVATEIYARVGVRLVWHSGATPPKGCSSEPMHSIVVIAFREDNPQGVSDYALGWANPYAQKGPCVTLLMQPLEDAIRAHPDVAHIVTGHALAHEIGHVLEGVARHSETGLMKERWSIKDILNMQSRWLDFAGEDATLIQDSFRITSAAK